MRWFRWLEKRRQHREERIRAAREEGEKQERLLARAREQVRPIGWVLEVEQWGVETFRNGFELTGDGKNDTLITCWFGDDEGVLEMVSVRGLGSKMHNASMYFLESGECYTGWHNDNPVPKGMMARALFCLGIDDPAAFAEFDPDFSMHEKLELRLSMPREFWPKQWPDELDV